MATGLTAIMIGFVREEELEDYLFHKLVHSPSDTPAFFLVLPADRYSTEYCILRVSGAYDPAAIEGLARKISSAPFLVDQDTQEIWKTLDEKREGLQFFEGHHMIIPNVYMVDYGS